MQKSEKVKVVKAGDLFAQVEGGSGIEAARPTKQKQPRRSRSGAPQHKILLQFNLRGKTSCGFCVGGRKLCTNSHHIKSVLRARGTRHHALSN